MISNPNFFKMNFNEIRSWNTYKEVLTNYIDRYLDFSNPLGGGWYVPKFYPWMENMF